MWHLGRTSLLIILLIATPRPLPAQGPAEKECDEVWDGLLFGILPGLGASVFYAAFSFCGETGDSCAPILWAGAAGGAVAGLVLDGALCHRETEEVPALSESQEEMRAPGESASTDLRLHALMETQVGEENHAGLIREKFGLENIEKVCDPYWDGALFGMLPVLGVAIVYGAGVGECDEHEGSCAPFFLSAAAAGAALGVVLDYSQCHQRKED